MVATSNHVIRAAKMHELLVPDLQVDVRPEQARLDYA